jgi:hypothetical protein
MNCFNHRDKPAVGLCKSCGKGLCGDCLTELPHGLACKDSCEERVNAVARMFDTQSKFLAQTKCRIQKRGFFIILMGAGLLLFSLSAPFQSERSYLSSFLAFIGFAVLAAGILTFSGKSPPPDENES